MDQLIKHLSLKLRLLKSQHHGIKHTHTHTHTHTHVVQFLHGVRASPSHHCSEDTAKGPHPDEPDSEATGGPAQLREGEMEDVGQLHLTIGGGGGGGGRGEGAVGDGSGVRCGAASTGVW